MSSVHGSITAQTGHSQHLVLRLKAEKEVLEKKIQKLDQKVEERTNDLSASIVRRPVSSSSNAPISATSVDIENELFFSIISDEVSEEVVQKKLKLHDKKSKLEDAKKQKAKLDEGEKILEQNETVKEKFSLFQNLLEQAKMIAHREGTTLAAIVATTWLAVGPSLPLPALPSVLVLASQLMAAGVTANELKKALIRHLNDVGVTDHLKAIENALQNILEKNEAAAHSIEEAEKINGEISLSLDQITLMSDAVKEALESTDSEIRELAKKALKNFQQSEAVLTEQKSQIQLAIDSSQEGLDMINLLKKQLEMMLNSQIKIDANTDLETVLKEIEERINGILAECSTLCDLQLKSNECMLKVLRANGELSRSLRKAYEHVGEMKGLQGMTQQTIQKVEKLENEIESLSELHLLSTQELQKQKKFNREQAVQARIAQDQVEQEKQVEKFGDTSIRIGGGMAAGVGAGTGFMLSGPGGGMLGAVVSCTLLNQPMIRVAHYARKFMRALSRVESREQFQRFEKGLKAGKKDETVTVSATYEKSQGSVIGMKGVKEFWNLLGSGLRLITEKELMSRWTSSYAGVVHLCVGSVPLEIHFDARNDKTYGAISLVDQQSFIKTLSLLLEEKVLRPKSVLEILAGLSSIHLGDKDIVMIDPESPAIEILKKNCAEILN